MGNNLEDKGDEIVSVNASEMARNARRLAPVDFGKLVQSISRKKLGYLRYGVTAGVKYAAYVEFGTGGLVSVPEELREIAARFKGRGIRRINMRPQPFMWPALQIQRDILLDDIRDLIRRETK